AGLLGELGEQIVISESVAPEVSSDAPTSIGSFKPDDATVTHFEMSSGDGMTDPFGRPEGPKAATTEALTAPQVALPAPNLFVSESFLRGEDGSPDAPVGKEASAPAPDSAPPGGEAVAGADPLEADLAGVEIETWPSKLPAAPPADPYEADLAGLVAEPSDAHAAEKPIAAVVASEHAAPAQLQASPSDEQADEPLIEGTLLPDSDDDEAAAGPAVDEPVLLATALPVEGAAELPLTPGADEQVQHQAAAQPFRQKPPADRALGALPETDASSKSAQSPAPTVDPGVRGDGQLGLSDAKEHFFGEEEAPRAPESPGATAPSEPEPDAGGLVDPWDVEQGSPGGNAGRSAQQAAVPAWRSDSVEPLETWTWDDGPVEPLEVLQGSAGDNGGPAAAAPVAPSLTPGAGAGGSVTYSDAHLESLGAGPIAPPENPLQVPGAQGAFGALSEASELEGAATREEPWDVERTPSAEAGAWKSPKSSASLWATPPPV
ncbi:MAG TPA: hypothetical protein DFS52_23560, partial [Myxococcales bacterium]|nr:hypothetical protein [Myxococcales bacterium]